MQAIGLQTYIWNNNIRSALLLIGFPILLIGMVFFLTLGMIWAGMLPPGESYGGDVNEALGLMWGAAPAAIIVAAIWFVIAYFFNETIIDFATGSRLLSREEEPRAYNLLENLCISRGLNMPKLRVIETDEMNAFASGLHEGRFSVTVTRGILASLDDRELEAVLGHELTHIINRDVRTMVIAAIFAGIITLICQIIYRSIMWGGFGGLRGRRGNVGVFNLQKALTSGFGPGDFVGMIPVKSDPTGIAASPNGQYLYVVSGLASTALQSGMGTLTIVDMRKAETSPGSSVRSQGANNASSRSVNVLAGACATASWGMAVLG